MESIPKKYERFIINYRNQCEKLAPLTDLAASQIPQILEISDKDEQNYAVGGICKKRK